MDRRDLLGREDRADVFNSELLRSGAHSLLLAVPPQPHHGRQVLHRAVVHAAGQVRELPLDTVTVCRRETQEGKSKRVPMSQAFTEVMEVCVCVLLTVHS